MAQVKITAVIRRDVLETVQTRPKQVGTPRIIALAMFGSRTGQAISTMSLWTMFLLLVPHALWGELGIHCPHL